jgi:protocatechuate 3,4-dioxygenase beta subunit
MRQILFALLILLLQQSPQPQATASIEGSVLKLGTTEAVPRAKVTLSQQGSPNSQAITADDGGKFAFRNIAPGQYRLTATRDGYVAAEFGQRGPGAAGVQITLVAQQHMKDARIEMTLTGVISGRVLNRYGEPVGNANVQALRYTYQEGRRSLTPFQSIRTNDLGEYRLFWMSPGQYVISAQAADTLAVDPGGTVFVQAMRGGGPGLPGAFGAQLGVGGVTRIAVTGGPPPDIAFGGAPVPPPPPPPPPIPGAVVDDSNLTVPVYYPGTTDVVAAAPIELRSGGVIGGINFTVVEARPARIRGQVISGGRPAAGAQVSIFQRGNVSGTLTVRNVPVSDTGMFEFRNLAPGGYELIATINAAGPGAMIVGTPLGNAAGLTAANVGVGRGGRVPGAPVMAARAQVDVVNADVEGVTLLLENGFNVNGKVTLEGRAAGDAATSGVRIQLQSDPMVPPLAVPGVSTEADGTFSITGVPSGNYRLSVGALPRNTYVKAALIGGIDVLNTGGLRLEGEPRGGLDILLGNSPGSVEAAVVDSRKMPISGVTVALVPDSARRKRYDLFRQATTDASGRVRIENVVPGDYKVLAWEVVESNAWTDPDFLSNYENNGVLVRVGEGGRAAVDVQAIPYKAN